ncbi:Uncharacterised protein [uncultured archaeon]|nr:Uncharacterised protein [uncultured archaeon]
MSVQALFQGKRGTTIGQAMNRSVEFHKAAKFVETWTGKELPRQFEMVRVDTSKKSWRGGVFRGKFYIGEVPPAKIPLVYSHKLVHVWQEDFSEKAREKAIRAEAQDFLSGYSMVAVVRIYKEGQAVFLASNYVQDRKYEKRMKADLALAAGGSVLIVSVASIAAGTVGGLLASAAGIYAMAIPAMYSIFTSALRKLEKKVGDAQTAFRISCSKVPTKWSELLFPLKFYKQEIDAALQAKKEN